MVKESTALFSGMLSDKAFKARLFILGNNWLSYYKSADNMTHVDSHTLKVSQVVKISFTMSKGEKILILTYKASR